MTASKPQFWFPAKRYGWGWGPPVTWQGWVVVGAFFTSVIGGTILISPERTPVLFFTYHAALVAALIGVCWVKGEPPRWRWGK